MNNVYEKAMEEARLQAADKLTLELIKEKVELNEKAEEKATYEYSLFNEKDKEDFITNRNMIRITKTVKCNLNNEFSFLSSEIDQNIYLSESLDRLESADKITSIDSNDEFGYHYMFNEIKIEDAVDILTYELDYSPEELAQLWKDGIELSHSVLDQLIEESEEAEENQ